MTGAIRTSLTSLVVMAVAASGIVLAQQPVADGGKAGIDVVRIRKNIFLLTGAGGNVTISIGPDGVLLVDSGNKESSDQVLAAIRHINRDLNGPWQPVTEPGNGEGHEESVLTTPAPPKPIRFIINTSARPDHTSGNASLGKAGLNVHRWKRRGRPGRGSRRRRGHPLFRARCSIS